MNCKQTEALLSLYAGRDLEEKNATLATEHLQTCAACARVADEYRESVQLTAQFAPPIFSETVYAGIRQRVLREIETETMAPAWSQTISSFFPSRLRWAMAGVLLILFSIFAIYFIVKSENDKQQFAGKLPSMVQPETNERANSEPRDNQRSSLVKTGANKQLARVPESRRRKRSLQPNSMPEPMLFPHDSAAIVKTLRVEIQTKDPKIRIIWFVPQETKPIIPGSKGT